MSRDILISEGHPYARKRPGDGIHAYACATCRRLISYTLTQRKQAPAPLYIGIHCNRCGHTLPRRACKAYATRHQPKRRGWRK